MIAPSAFDLPVGSVVVTAERVYVKNVGEKTWTSVHPSAGEVAHHIQSGWIEGLFSDGLATLVHVPDEATR